MRLIICFVSVLGFVQLLLAQTSGHDLFTLTTNWYLEAVGAAADAAVYEKRGDTHFQITKAVRSSRPSYTFISELYSIAEPAQAQARQNTIMAAAAADNARISSTAVMTGALKAKASAETVERDAQDTFNYNLAAKYLAAANRLNAVVQAEVANAALMYSANPPSSGIGKSDSGGALKH